MRATWFRQDPKLNEMLEAMQHYRPPQPDDMD